MNAHNFTHTGYLMRIKAAILRAVRKANRPGQPRGLGHETVYNRNAERSLCIVARAGRGFEVFGGRDGDQDVTELVKAALRTYHASQPPRGAAVDNHDGSLARGLAFALPPCLIFWAAVGHFAFN